MGQTLTNISLEDNKTIKEGVAVINNNTLNGIIIFIQKDFYVEIIIDIKGLKRNSLHGFHIHEAGDLREGCNSCCKHYNPTNKTHGDLNDVNSHAGDLGNIMSDLYGNSKGIIRTTKITLNEIIGRSIIIHENRDDLGKGSNADSLITGNSGARIGCAIIGISKNNCK